MSFDVQGGTRVALVKRHYDADDYTSFRVDGVPPALWFNGLGFTATEDYYVVGFLAALHDPTVIDPERGWTLFTHGQAAAPAWLTTPLGPLAPSILDAMGLTPWPAQLPAFEAKDLLFYATENCWVRFEGDGRVQHFIPKGDYIRFHRRCFMFWVQQDTAEGTLYVWMEG